MPRLLPDIAYLPMNQDERNGVRAMAFATDEFEPYPAFVMAAFTLQSLIDRGLVERGPSNRPAVSDAGFRLTRSGMSELGRIW